MKTLINIIAMVVLSLTQSFGQHSEYELKCIQEINLARTNPKLYASYIREYIKTSKDTSLVRIAKKEILPMLDTMKPLQALKVYNEYHDSLSNHIVLNQMNQPNKKYYRYSDSLKNLKGFVTFNHAKWMYPKSKNKKCGENLHSFPKSYGNPRIGVMDGLIDVWAPNRSHRTNILNRTAKFITVKQLEFKNCDIMMEVFWN